MFSVTLQDRYQLNDELGSGGMGVVYRAHDLLLDRAIAIKLLNDPGLGGESRERLLREARAAARLNHPNIVSIYDVGGADNDQATPFIVMEMVEGHSLFDQPPESIKDTLAIAGQICAALDHAHRHGVVHRDLKLENILIDRDGTLKLTDFGLARSVASRLSTEGQIMGTVFYLAPELALGQPFDGRADLYALGVLLYELTTHKLPFDGDDPLAVVSQHLHAPVVPPSAHNPLIPPSLDSLIVRLLAKRPEDRPPTAADVRAELEAINLDAPSETTTSIEHNVSLLDRIVRGRQVGREHEMGEAATAWRRARHGEAQVLLISGEPGIGKSRLTREIAALAEVSGAPALIGECYAEGGAPYGPFAQVILTSFASRNPPALPPMVLADLITLAPSLRVRLPQVAPNAPLDPASEQQRLFDSAFEWLTALTASTPTLLVIDDAHWADAGSLALLRHLARRARLGRSRLCMVVTYREIELSEQQPLNELLMDLNRERLAARLKLTRLSREQTSTLLAVMFEEAITPDFLDGIYRETEGNPFFIEEVCKSLVEEGQLVYAEGQWRRPDMTQVTVPQSIRVAIQGRVSKLPEFVQESLRLAAAFGREFDFELLQRATESNEETLIEALELAARAQLIAEVRNKRRAGSETFAFAHALIPATLRESVSGLRRHRLHRRVAAALEALRPDDYEALAFQYAEAGDEAHARIYYAKAGARAQELFANQDAIKFYSEALSLFAEDDPARFDLLAARAAVYDVIANRAAQLRDGQAMLELAELLSNDARRFDALIIITDAHTESKEALAYEPIEQALALAQHMGDRVREAHALRRKAGLHINRFDYKASLAALESAISIGRETGQLADAAICLHMLSLVLGRQGELDPAQKAVEESIAICRAIGDRRQEAVGLRRLAILHDLRANYEQGINYCKQALAIHQQLGDRSQELNALLNLGNAYAHTGDWEQARHYGQLSLDLARAIEAGEGIGTAIYIVSYFGYRASGNYMAALNFLDQQLADEELQHYERTFLRVSMSRSEMLQSLGHHEQLLTLYQQIDLLPFGAIIAADIESFVAQVFADSGRFAEAHEALARANVHLQTEPSYPEQVGILLAGAYVDLREALTLPADSEQRQTLLQRADATCQNSIQSFKDHTMIKSIHEMRGVINSVHAYILLSLERIEESLQASTVAVEELERSPMMWVRLPEAILYVHAVALRANGRSEEAGKFIDRAYERVMTINAGLPPDYQKPWLEAVWVHPLIVQDWQASHSAMQPQP